MKVLANNREASQVAPCIHILHFIYGLPVHQSTCCLPSVIYLRFPRLHLRHSERALSYHVAMLQES